MTETTADSFEVSPQQEQLWLAEPDGPSGRIQAIVSLEGQIDALALQSALSQATQRHEILRTTFAHRPGIRVPLQAVAATLAPAWSALDISSAPAESADRLSELARAELAAPLDYSSGPLVRAVLVTLADTRHALILTLSALCADPSSATLVVREVMRHYGGAGELVEDPLQYADFSAWQRELESSDDDEASAAREFWAGAAGAAGPALPFTGAAAQPGAGDGSAPEQIAVRMTPEAAAALLAEAARYGAAPAGVAHAAWHAVLGASAGEDRVCVAFLGAERRHADLDGAVGAFARPVPIGSRVGPQVTFAELVQQLDAGAGEAGVWQDYAPAGSAAGLAVGFVQADAYRGSAGGLEASIEQLVVTGSGRGLWLTAIAGEQSLALSVQYDRAFIAPETAQRLAQRLERLLPSVAANAGASLGELDLLGEAEGRQLLVTYNDSGPAVVGGAVHELISAHAVAFPAREAVTDEHRALTYGELERRSNQLARRLRRTGVGPDVTVGLCTDRSVDMVVGLLAILKAGGAYIPLHYEHPPARLAHQLAAAGARAIVTQESRLECLPAFEGEVICLDRDRRELDGEDPSAPDVPVGPDNLVYVIYTSGSTGTPKGVGVTHGNLFNYASAIAHQLGADDEPLSFGAVTSISTDLGNTSVFGALCSGGTLVLISPVAAAEPGAFARQVQRSPIDVLKITPSHVGALLAGGDPGVLPRRWLVIGGERAPWDLVQRVRAISEVGILNHYGPTEATVGCCTFPVGDGPGEYRPATVPIGRPLAGTSCYVLGEQGRPVPLGAPGRLHVGGAGVARGYVGAAELTAERFLPDRFAAEPGARMYDTGDLARWLPDGALEFLGRVDEQVKIRGYRVEPAEVESALRAHENVREAVVVTAAGAAGDVRLVAYCTVDADPGQAALKAHLAGWLPEYMLPAAIVTLDAMPVTPSGKIDRLALPDPEQAGEPSADYVAPRTPVEQAITEIWSHVLGVEKLGVEEDFFALGGHSLLATQVVAQVRSDFAVDLPLHSLFTCPTVASLSAEIVRMMGASEEDETAALMAELEGLSDEDAEPRG